MILKFMMLKVIEVYAVEVNNGYQINWVSPQAVHSQADIIMMPCFIAY